MKTIFTFSSIVIGIIIWSSAGAQNVFPSTGRVGIYTTSPAASLQVRGGARIGTNTNYTNIDSATGNLSFAGTSAYRVAGNAYAFQYAGNPNYGLYFNQSGLQYEFRTSSALPIFSVGANNGNGVFTGGVQVGNSTSSVAGNIRWTGTDFQGYNGSTWKSLTTGTSYTAGTGISISNNVITNTAPDKIVTIGPAQNMTVTGAYPNYALAFVSPPWFTNGNAGTDPSVNFIGTTDARSLVFKVNNILSGLIEYSTFDSGKRNTAFGLRAFNSNTTGHENTITGYGALYTNTTGSYNSAYGKYSLFNNNGDNNTAFGYNTMFFNTSGTGNTATGAIALQNNTTGGYNTATGMNVLASNINGSYNTGSGLNALENNIDGINNTATGAAALQSNTSGANNSAHGMYSLYLNTTGQQNTASGYAALYSNINGNYNTATGSAALNNNTADNNTATGAYAMYLNTTGTNNSAYGKSALYNNSTGTGNTATGLESLFFNTVGSNNTANGLDALLSNTTGNNNTATGYQSLLGNLAGSYNTALGSNALSNNTQGSYNTALGANSLTLANVVNNTAIGYDALYENSSGNDNTAIGYSSMLTVKGAQNTAIGSGALVGSPGGFGNTSDGCTATGYRALSNNYGDYNTANGYNALLVNTAGSNNTAIGTNALFSVTTGSDNIALGYGADADAAVSNSIIIGKNVRATSSNIASIGNGSTTFLYGPIYITTSDGRFKKDIKENVPGLDFINALRPVSYKYKSYELQKFLLQNDQKKLSELKQSDFTDAEGKTHLGFIAQEVEKTMKEKGYGNGIVKDPATKDDSYGIAYNELIPPLVKAVQQLSFQNDSLRSINQKQQEQLNNIASLLNSLQQQVSDLKLKQDQCCSTAAINSNTSTQSAVVLGNQPSLEQNIPNPFVNTTTINYTLPQTNAVAQIIIRDKTGQALKTINVSGSGKGSLKVDATTLASGAYSYSLIVNGKLINTKQMILAK